jgi:sulfur carrier protein ThiS
MIELHLGGHLAFYAPQKQSRFSVPIDQPTELKVILQKLGVPLAEVAIVAVNGELVDLAASRVNPGDRIELYPPMGGG